MLTELKIKDFAIIDNLTLTLESGMSIFTGETGAGKSIIIGAVNLILAARASIDYLRTGSKEARVEAVFDISGNEPLAATLVSLGHEPSDTLIIKRIISASGKSRVIINDSFSTLGALAELAPMLINVFGQNDHHELLNMDAHLSILDGFGLLATRLEEYRKIYFDMKRVEESLKQLTRAAASREKEIDFIRYQRREISAANLRPGEEAELTREKELLLNAEKVTSTCALGFERLYADDGSVSATLSELLGRLEELKSLDSSFEGHHNNIQNVLYALEDTAFFFRDYPKNIDTADTSIDEIEARLEVISEMKRKYGGSEEKALQSEDDLRVKLETLENLSENFDKLEKSRAELYKKAAEQARRLSEERKSTALKLTDDMATELALLGMESAGFEVRFSDTGTQLSEDGIDQLEFYFCPNRGEEFKPLIKIASGGELSRIMLAIKNVTKSATAPPATLIFDEVDAGIGGKTADIVGARLKSLAGNNQVVCITHLSQIAAYADTHYFVKKALADGRTVTEVHRLDENARVNEVARMLSGEVVTEHSLKHAADMITRKSY